VDAHERYMIRFAWLRFALLTLTCFGPICAPGVVGDDNEMAPVVGVAIHVETGLEVSSLCEKTR
jgi:hypothetical protein